MAWINRPMLTAAQAYDILKARPTHLRVGNYAFNLDWRQTSNDSENLISVKQIHLVQFSLLKRLLIKLDVLCDTRIRLEDELRYAAQDQSVREFQYRRHVCSARSAHTKETVEHLRSEYTRRLICKSSRLRKYC